MGSQSWFNRLLTDAWNFLVPVDWALRSIPMMNTNFAVILVIVYSYLPFMILPLYANLERLDPTLDEAAMDLGSRPWKVFRDVTLPLSAARHHRRRPARLHSGLGRTDHPDAWSATPPTR